jgi:hypothetical protein
VDVIESGPYRPDRAPGALQRLLRRVGRRLLTPGRGRRLGALALGVAAAAAVLVGLRAGVPQAGQPSPQARPLATLPAPPYDRLPGRTPIPAPTVSRDRLTVGGELPVFAPAPSEAAVRIDALLILNRYCREPATHAIELQQGVGEAWRSVTAVVYQARIPLPYRPEITLHLYWTGYTYRWQGSLPELTHCA